MVHHLELNSAEKLKIYTFARDPYLYQYFRVSNRCFWFAMRHNINWLFYLCFKKLKLVHIYKEIYAKIITLCYYNISITVLSNILMTLHLHPFAKWQLCWCCRYAAAAVRLGGRHNMPPPRDLDFWPSDLEVGVGVACDLGYPCAKFRLPRPFGFRVRAHVHDIRRTPMTA